MRFRLINTFILVTMLLGFSFSISVSPVAAQATITVNSALDAASPATDGNCTLREAITNATNNAATFSDCAAGTNTGTDTIQFAIGAVGSVQTINAVSTLNVNTDVIIDATSQSGAAGCQNITTPLIVLDGTSSAASSTGFLVGNTSNGAVIRGFNIRDFGWDGIELRGTNALVQCNFIGTDETGTVAAGNARTGVGVTLGAASNNIVGTNGDGINDAAEGNLISNNLFGMYIGDGATGTRVAGNIIGLDVTATVDFGNGSLGIWIVNGTGNHIIGTNGDGVSDALEGNIVSGNNAGGIQVQSANTTNVVIAGNIIGLNGAGTSAIANSGAGITISTSSGHRIGTNGDGVSDALEGNVISGNFSNGIAIGSSSTTMIIAGNIIGTDITGSVDLGNGNHGILVQGQNNRIGTDGNGTSDTLERNLISGNGAAGIFLNTSGTRIAGNYIGTNSAGNSAIPNITGINLNAASNNTIGTNSDGAGDANEGNLISGNSSYGIYLTGSTGNTIAANFIGTTASGTAALANGDNGIRLENTSTGNTIGTNGNGTSDALEGNLISGNGSAGVSISVNSSSTIVAGNKIGTDINGTADLGNDGIGIFVSSGSNRIGTNGNGVSDALEGNLISGNRLPGIVVDSANATNNRIAGNIIGLNLGGSAAIPNDTNGIAVRSSATNTLIGTNGDGVSDALEANIVSGNGQAGILLQQSSSATTIAGNIIGLNPAGTLALGNGGAGINITDSTTNTIGGNLASEGNLISGNSSEGINLTATASGNNIQYNLIGTNSALQSLPNGTNGISLTGTSSNTTISDNLIFYHPTTGILMSSTATLAASSQNNCIYQNAAGMNNTTGSNAIFENNWWGAASGPSGVGTGNGDSVSANVDYIAFLTVAPTNCPGTAGVIIDPLALSVTEGGTASYTLVLDSQPAVGETVTITVTIDAAAAGELASTVPATLSFDFDSTNWNTPQSFDITLNDDLITNGNRTYTAAFTHSSDSTDPTSGYDATAALVIDSVDLTVVDDESPNVVINPTAWSLIIGDSRDYAVSLTLEPASDVTITLTQLDANCTISTTTLTFTNSAGASPWNVPQQVTVIGVGAVGANCTIQHTPTGGGYTGVVAADVVVTLRRGNVPPTVVIPEPEPEIGVFDPAISKLGLLFPGQTGIVGEELEWVVTVSNVGTVVGTNVTVTDTLIPALRIDSVDAPGGTVSISGQTVTVTYSTLAVGQTVNFSIFTTVLQGVTIENSACVNASNQGVQECVTALPISQLPSTGEAPLWRDALLIGLLSVLALASTKYLYQKRKTNLQ